MAIAFQVLVSLVSIQVTVALSVKFKHLVAETSTDFETFLESLLGLKLVFLNLSLLFTDFSHLEAEIASLRLYDLYRSRLLF